MTHALPMMLATNAAALIPSLTLSGVACRLGLYHPFNGGCNATGGDYVDDTPPMCCPEYRCNVGVNSCPTYGTKDPGGFARLSLVCPCLSATRCILAWLHCLDHITEIIILLIAAKQGPNFLSCMPKRTICILLASMMSITGCSGRVPQGTKQGHKTKLVLTFVALCLLAVHNIMGYSDDSCMTGFTPNQVTR
jgi:hypothetical protein